MKNLLSFAIIVIFTVGITINTGTAQATVQEPVKKECAVADSTKKCCKKAVESACCKKDSAIHKSCCKKEMAAQGKCCKKDKAACKH
jgi:hypothetical protein